MARLHGDAVGASTGEDKVRQFLKMHRRSCRLCAIMNLRKLPIFHLESIRARSSIHKTPAMQNPDSVGALLRDKTSVLHSITTTATVLDAIRMMAEKNIGAVPVLQ